MFSLVILQADLIHLGAKFSPCMHRDAQVYEEIDKAIAIENNTGCCIRTDQSGCVQTPESDCSVGIWGRVINIYICHTSKGNTAIYASGIFIY